MREGIIPFEDVQDEEPYLFLGLLSVTILECVVRSLNSGGMKMILGDKLTEFKCPEEGKGLFRNLEEIKLTMMMSSLSIDELKLLKRIVLGAEPADSILARMDM
jgi:hypothetical protein